MEPVDCVIQPVVLERTLSALSFRSISSRLSPFALKMLRLVPFPSLYMREWVSLGK